MIQAEPAEKSSVVFTIGTTAFPTIQNTAGDTVTVTLTDATTPGASAITVGTASGAAAGTAIAVTLNLATNGISTGRWNVEAVADINGANPKVLIPNISTGFPYTINIKPMNSF